MAALRTANPALNDSTFKDVEQVGISGEAMTLTGCIYKTAVLLALLVLAAAFTWQQYYQAGPQTALPYMLGGLIGGAILGLITAFARTWAFMTAPLYAVAQGLLLGGLSALFETRFPMIAFQAVFLTFGVLACLLLAYLSGLIRPSENFKLGIAAASGAVCLLYLASIVLGLFGISIPYLHSSGPLGIAISIVIVVIAALNLVLDFDFIESGVERGAPKYLEWYAAFGLIVTLVWLYIEILRLLSKLRSK